MASNSQVRHERRNIMLPLSSHASHRHIRFRQEGLLPTDQILCYTAIDKL